MKIHLKYLQDYLDLDLNVKRLETGLVPTCIINSILAH